MCYNKVEKMRAKIKNIIPKTFLTINHKQYRAISPIKALTISKKLKKGTGRYRVHVVYGEKYISPRKKEKIENTGIYSSAKEAKQAIIAFLNKDLWIS